MTEFPYRTLNPTTEQLVETYQPQSEMEVEAVARALHEGFLKWRETPWKERRRLLLSLAEKLKGEKPRLAPLITEEMGKPLTQSEAEIDKCVWGCSYFAEQGESFLQEELLPSDAGKSYVRFDPLGVVLIIMPWNFPFWQVFRCSVPALMAGNTVLLKHAPNVPGCATKIVNLFRSAGFPEGVFDSVFCSHGTVAQLIETRWIQAISLTGSDRAGGQIAALAGRSLKKTVMELGGSDPFIVLRDADLAACIPAAIRSRFLNAGQSCIAAKRFILAQEIAGDFEKAFVREVMAQRVGDPMDRATQIGPLAREDLLQNLIRQVEESKRQGATCLFGGERRPGKGYFYLPTVLKNIQPSMIAFNEETFGPVACLTVTQTEEEALELANQTPYGLGASLWTRDLKKAERWTRTLEAGSVFINGMTRSDPRLPFGGIKRSGFGRELSLFGIREFTNLKTVWIA